MDVHVCTEGPDGEGACEGEGLGLGIGLTELTSVNRQIIDGDRGPSSRALVQQGVVVFVGVGVRVPDGVASPRTCVPLFKISK